MAARALRETRVDHGPRVGVRFHCVDGHLDRVLLHYAQRATRFFHPYCVHEKRRTAMPCSALEPTVEIVPISYHESRDHGNVEIIVGEILIVLFNSLLILIC